MLNIEPSDMTLTESENVDLMCTDVSKSSELDQAIDNSLLQLPLDDAEEKIIAKIIDAPNRSELQEQFDLFNMNQSKKNALRIIKLNGLLSKVEDQAIARFEKRPDQVSNKELLEYMNVVSSQIDRAQKQVDMLKDAPAIQVNNQKNEVNISIGNQLDRDSKERVMDAISGLLKQIRANVVSDDSNSESAIEVEGEIITDCITETILEDELPMEETDDDSI